LCSVTATTKEPLRIDGEALWVRVATASAAADRRHMQSARTPARNTSHRHGAAASENTASRLSPPRIGIPMPLQPPVIGILSAV
jgi:hypothetical protein